MDVETGAELAIKQVELHPESGQSNVKVDVARAHSKPSAE